MRRVAVALVLVVAACGGSSAKGTQAPVITTTTSTTDVRSLCEDATAALADQIFNELGGRIEPQQYNDPHPFSTLLRTSLQDCSSRIEWLTSIGHRDEEKFLSEVFLTGCQKERFVHNVGGAEIAVACHAQ